MKCPECGNEQYCPCTNCANTYSRGKNTWIWIDGELIKCTFCGLTKHADWWMDEEWKEFKKLTPKEEEIYGARMS